MTRDVCEHFNPVDLPCEKCSANVQKSTLREAAQQALEALQLPCPRWNGAQSKIVNAAIDALRAALAEPVQEPVAWLIEYEGDEREVRFVAGTRGIRQTPLYTATPASVSEAPQRKPLSGLDVERLLEQVMGSLPVARRLVRAVERAHGIGGKDE